MPDYPQTIPEIQAAIDRSFADVQTIAEPLSPEQFQAHPLEGKWSFGENMDHLILSTMGIASALSRPKEFFDRFGEPDQPSRTCEALYQEFFPFITGRQAPENMTPDANAPKSKEELLGSWRMIRSKYFERLPANWQEKELDRHCVMHPAFGRITMREMLFFIIFHNEHHLRAMNRLLEAV